MYDFHLGTPDEIAGDEKTYLLSVKRMLPRWVNSIPDSEYLAIVDLLEEHCARPHPVLVETGSGASSIALLHHALKYDGVLYSWDFVGPKGAYLRGVSQDTLLATYRKNVWDHWRFIAFDSLSPHLGVPVLRELVDRIDFCFFDSEHTLDTLLGEVDAVDPLLVDGSVVAVDDGNYDYVHTNFAYVNLFRRKLGLPPVDEPADAHGEVFWRAVERRLSERWRSVSHLDDTYKPSCRDDLFFAYFGNERKIMDAAAMEKLGDLEHRFDAWRVEDRIAAAT